MKILYQNEDGTRRHFNRPEEYRAAVDAVEEQLIEMMGERAALDAITRALSYNEKEEIYAYIIRCYDI